jgi:hypothetical protein
MKLKIENPDKLCGYTNKVVTSWKLTYMGQDFKEGIYHYVLTHKENNRIKIRVEIHSQTQQLYNPESFQLLDNEWVKIRLIHPLKKDVIKFIRVEEFKDMRRVFNTLHDVARKLLQ